MAAKTSRKVVRGILGLVALVAVVIVISNWWGDYRSATGSAGTPSSQESTSSVSATGTTSAVSAGTTPAKVQTVLILIDGLNLREQATTQSASKRVLKKGDRLTLISNKGAWLQVRDSTGVEGWVANSPQYAAIED
ncbi:MAG: SH3 domain-containing protein [Coriobacteriia bacterium]|nr:SH3 domain-containing protein [Coriobacteriia bacterium]